MFVERRFIYVVVSVFYLVFDKIHVYLTYLDTFSFLKCKSSHLIRPYNLRWYSRRLSLSYIHFDNQLLFIWKTYTRSEEHPWRFNNNLVRILMSVEVNCNSREWSKLKESKHSFLFHWLEKTLSVLYFSISNMKRHYPAIL